MQTDAHKIGLETIFGLILALLVPILYALWIGPAFVEPATQPVTYALIGFVVYWVLAASVLLITSFLVGKDVASLGFKSLPWKTVALAVGLGIVLSLAVPLLTVLATSILPAAESGGVTDTATSYPAWIILLSVLTAGITEEVLFRGYAIERLTELTGSVGLSTALSLLAFVLAHGGGWNLAHIVGVVIPLGAILTGLYLWKRNLIFVIIIHVVIDLPLFFISLGS